MSLIFGFLPPLCRRGQRLRLFVCQFATAGIGKKISVWMQSAPYLLAGVLVGSCVGPPAHNPAISGVPVGLLDVHSAHFGAFIILNDAHQTLHEFEELLRSERVSDVVPVEKMWLQGTDWRSHEHTAYAIPPKESWPKIVRTLKFMRRELIPVIGPVEVMSGFRTPTYNFIAGGAPRSQHLTFSALDVRPKTKVSRRELHASLQRIWRRHGKTWDFGLGLYAGTRFHIDTGGYRQW
jgi:uncharacterized protein YcbK (DUF882 family)